MAIPFTYPVEDDIQHSYQRLDQLLADLFDVLQQILVTQRHIREAQPSNITRNRSGLVVNGRRGADGEEQTPTLSPLNLNTSDGRVSLDLPGSSGLVSSGLASVGSASSSGLGTLGAAMTMAPADRTPLVRVDQGENQVRNSNRRRRRRRRTASETSCCDESKRATSSGSAANQAATSEGWTQVGVNLRKIADDFYASVGKVENGSSAEAKRPCAVENSSNEAGLLSMLSPPPFGGSIWTAVIFLVGWRLFRAR